MTTAYSFLRLNTAVPSPGLPPGAHNFRDSFDAPEFNIAFDGSVLTVTHAESGRAVDVPISAVKYGVRMVYTQVAHPHVEPAPASKKASRK